MINPFNPQVINDHVAAPTKPLKKIKASIWAPGVSVDQGLKKRRKRTARSVTSATSKGVADRAKEYPHDPFWQLAPDGSIRALYSLEDEPIVPKIKGEPTNE